MREFVFVFIDPGAYIFIFDKTDSFRSHLVEDGFLRRDIGDSHDDTHQVSACLGDIFHCVDLSNTINCGTRFAFFCDVPLNLVLFLVEFLFLRQHCCSIILWSVRKHVEGCGFESLSNCKLR